MRILLLSGGDSREREVSLTSGKAVYESLRRLGHSVLAVDPASGLSLTSPDGQFLASGVCPPDTSTMKPASAGGGFVSVLRQSEQSEIELVFLALHGGAGENGTIQALLDMSGVPYTGAGMTASAIAMDKAISKRLFSSAGISTPRWKLYEVDNDNSLESLIVDAGKRFSFPFIVKPNDAGSTVALSLVSSQGEIHAAFALAGRESRRILAEEYIAGKELTVAVLSGRTFPVVEIRPKSGLYDYKAKYTPGMTEYVAPAEISDEIARNIRDAALDAYRVVGARSLARVDFILDSDGAIHILEINTLPGMTELSLAPMAAKCEGIEFDRFVQLIIEDALRGRS